MDNLLYRTLIVTCHILLTKRACLSQSRYSMNRQWLAGTSDDAQKRAICPGGNQVLRRNGANPHVRIHIEF